MPSLVWAHAGISGAGEFTIFSHIRAVYSSSAYTCTPRGCYVAATWGWDGGWGGMLTFMCTCTPRGCYVAASCLPYASVNHSLLEFSRQVHCLNQKPVTAGTQTLDRAWQDLKKYVPSEITAKDPKTKKVNPALWDWIYSWMWRRNCKGDVWAAMPALFH